MNIGNRFRALVAGLSVFGIAAVLAGEAPRNVILMIGDGMGPEHIKAAGLFAYGREGSLFMETLPKQAGVVTCPASTASFWKKVRPVKITDSAAAATAIATGRKVFNTVLSVALPGDGKPLPTILEQAAAAGKRTGLVTTSYLTDATPAAFGAHVRDRNLHKQIAIDYLKTSRPNLILGGAVRDATIPLNISDGQKAGYLTVTNRAGLQAATRAGAERLLGLFGRGPMCYEYDYLSTTRKDYDELPHLSEMTEAALTLLALEPKGFFVMIEGACIDKASHDNNLERTLHEMLAFDKAVQLAAQWAAGRKDTLLIVAADHETGGLKVVKGGCQGKMPMVTWAAKIHTGANVRLFAVGPGSKAIAGTLDNTDIARLALGTFTGPTPYRRPVAAAGEPEAGTDGD